MAFKANFVDGPWAGQTLTADIQQLMFEVCCPAPDGMLKVGWFFRYEAGPVRTTTGIEEADFRCTYDGPMYVNGKHA